MSRPPTRLRLQIHGRVQGVWFRDSVRRTATEHGVSGWAENLPDGSVEAVLEGEPDAVRAVAAFCRQGPAHARVDRVDEREEPVRGTPRLRDPLAPQRPPPGGAQTSTGSSLPARRSRPRCTAAMNFDRLTSSVLRISSA